MGTQMGKSDLGLNTIGQVLDDSPVPILYLAPTKELVTSISRDRVSKMIRNAPSLSKKVADGGLDNITEKWVSGTPLRFIWAHSASQMSSHPACIVILDELDRMPLDVAGEGSPIALAEGRTATYPDAIIIILTTPTIAGKSPGERQFLAGTQFRWHWPCLGCNVFFFPKLAYLRWPAGSDKDSVYDSGAWVECPKCGHKHYNSDKDDLNARGVFLSPGQSATIDGEKITVVGDPKKSRTASFWINGLCTPFKSFEYKASRFLEASKEGTIEEVKAVVNTQFGESFEIQGEHIEEKDVAGFKIDIPLQSVHNDAKLLTAGVDVHKNNLCLTVRAWGVNEVSWQVFSKFLVGPTNELKIWKELQEILEASFFSQDDKEFKILRMAIDSQFESDMVYDFAAKNKLRVMACDGSQRRLGTPVTAKVIEVNASGKRIPGGLKLWNFDKHFFRDWIYSRMCRPPSSAGRWLVSKYAEQDYCRQIVAEELVAGASGSTFWQVRQGFRANHYLDAEVHARVAAHVVNLDRILKKRQERRAPRRRVIRRI